MKQKTIDLVIIDLYPHYKIDDGFLTFLYPSVADFDSIYLTDALADYLIFSICLDDGEMGLPCLVYLSHGVDGDCPIYPI